MSADLVSPRACVRACVREGESWELTRGRACVRSLTQATDTSNIRLVFAAVKETILQNALKDSGIL